MSDHEQGKSEEATPFKLDEARKKGMVARSVELPTFVSILAGAGYLAYSAPHIGREVGEICLRLMSGIGTYGDDAAAPMEAAAAAMTVLAKLVLPAVCTGWGVALITAFVQTGPLFAVAAIKPDWNRLNPVEGIKRFLSPLILFEFIRTLVKVVAFSLAMIFIVLRIFRELPAHQFDAMGLLSSLSPMSWASVRILILIAAAFALFDVFIVKRRFSKQMMMSRREVREEARNREGDPRIRQRRRQLQREMLRRASSMRGVREADVLVVNPVHFAIALRFDRGTMIAPQVTAKGAGEFALRLKSIAFTYGVPIVEDRVLARKLFFQIKLKECIGETFYKSVGKIYVNLRHKPSGGGAA